MFVLLQVLYRMDGNIWSIMPPCSPRSSSFRRIQMQDFTTFDDAAQLESGSAPPSLNNYSTSRLTESLPLSTTSIYKAVL